MNRSLLIVAGEKSGETYGAAVVRQFRELRPGWSVFGVGGSKMAAEGVDIIFPMNELSLVGVFEILTELPRVRKLFNRLIREIEDRRPAAAVLIDSPDFNLRLAKKLNRRGVPVLYYIGPTVWAWRKGRLKTIKKHVRKMCLIFPFEDDFYRKEGVPARFVGHPLLERVRTSLSREEFFAKYELAPDRKLIAVLPGSRRGEIRFHLPVLAEAIKKIQAGIPSQFVLVLAEDLNPAVLNAALPSDFPPVRILKEDAYEAMAAADLVLSACGTANLEAALLGTPFIAFYRVLPLTYWAFIRLVKTSSYSIVNILAGKKIVPELIQRDFTADNVFREAKAILESEDGGEKMKSRFRLIRTSLGSGHASRNVAEELAGLI